MMWEVYFSDYPSGSKLEESTLLLKFRPDWHYGPATWEDFHVRYDDLLYEIYRVNRPGREFALAWQAGDGDAASIWLLLTLHPTLLSKLDPMEFFLMLHRGRIERPDVDFEHTSASSLWTLAARHMPARSDAEAKLLVLPTRRLHS